MAVLSAGIMLYKRTPEGLQILLVHPGGPFWRRRDLGAWSIPKGEYGLDEAADLAARREFEEETGQAITAPLAPLGEARQPSGKRITAFAAQGTFDVGTLKSNLFELEWPPRSGRVQLFPEVDRAAWFDPDTARAHILPGQVVFIDRLVARLAGGQSS